MQSARDLVAVPAELPARVQLREDDRESRQTLLGHHVDGDAGAPVPNGDRVVRMDVHVDPLVSACEGFVDRVVDRLVDQVVQPSRACRPDVHARTQAHRLEALEHGDVLGGIRRLCQKKVLLKRGLRASKSLPERSVGSSGSQACRGGGGNRLPQAVVLDSGRHPAAFLLELRRHFQHGPRAFFHRLGGGLG